MFFTAPVMGSVLDLDMNAYKDIQHFDGKKRKTKLFCEPNSNKGIHPRCEYAADKHCKDWNNIWIKKS